MEKLCLRMGQTHQPRKWRDLGEHTCVCACVLACFAWWPLAPVHSLRPPSRPRYAPVSAAFCLSQLPLSDKGLRKLTEHFGHYQEALSDEEVLHHFNATVTKAKVREQCGDRPCAR